MQSLEQCTAAVENLGGYAHGLYAERWAPYVKVSPVQSSRSTAEPTCTCTRCLSLCQSRCWPPSCFAAAAGPFGGKQPLVLGCM